MIHNHSLSAENPSKARPTLSRVLNRIHFMVIVIAIGLAGILLTLLALLAIRAHTEKNLQLIARAISYTSEAAIVFNDNSAVREALKIIAVNEEFYQATITSPGGELIAEWKRPANATWNKLGQYVGHLAFPAPVSLPIVHSGETVALITLSADGSGMIGFLLQVFVGLLLSLLLSALIAFYLSKHMLSGIVGSLQHITHVAHDVSANRTFNIRVPSASIAELHELSSDFNSLLNELESWQNHLKIENDSLIHKALHDGLTGLYNRAFFIDTLNQCFNPLRAENSLALLFIDVDNFKHINDSLGHAAGDIVLTTLGERLSPTIRDSDLLCRLGGDEFAILLSPIHSQEEACHIADHIVQSMQQPISLLGNNSLYVALSIGIALYPWHGQTAKELLERADGAMYRSKNVAGSCWHLAGNVHSTNGTHPIRSPMSSTLTEKQP